MQLSILALFIGCQGKNCSPQNSLSFHSTNFLINLDFPAESICFSHPFARSPIIVHLSKGVWKLAETFFVTARLKPALRRAEMRHNPDVP